MRNHNSLSAIIFLTAVALIMSTACHNRGGAVEEADETSGAKISSLSMLPDLKGIVASSTADASTSKLLESPIEFGLATPFSAITSSEIGTYFFGDLLETSVSDLLREKYSEFRFFQNFSDSMAKCNVISSTARSFGRLENSGNTLCYMKKVPDHGEYTILAGSPDEALSMFEKGEDDRTVKVSVVGDEEFNSGKDTSVIIKVLGEKTAPNSKYEFIQFECQDNVMQGYMHTIIGADDKMVMHSANARDEDGDHSYESSVMLTAHLIERANGDIGFDHSETKHFSINNKYGWEYDGDSGIEIFNSKVVISPTLIEMMKQSKNSKSDSGDYFLDRVYSVSEYEGSDLSSVSFSKAAILQSSQDYNSDGEIMWQPTDENGDPVMPSIGISYNAEAVPRYETDLLSSLYSQVSGRSDELSAIMVSSLDEDVGFDFSTVHEPDPVDIVSLAAEHGVSCEITGDFHVLMDFNEESNMAIREECESDHENDDICNIAWDHADKISKAFGNHDMSDYFGSDDCRYDSEGKSEDEYATFPFKALAQEIRSNELAQCIAGYAYSQGESGCITMYSLMEACMGGACYCPFMEGGPSGYDELPRYGYAWNQMALIADDGGVENFLAKAFSADDGNSRTSTIVEHKLACENGNDGDFVGAAIHNWNTGQQINTSNACGSVYGMYGPNSPADYDGLQIRIDTSGDFIGHMSFSLASYQDGSLDFFGNSIDPAEWVQSGDTFVKVSYDRDSASYLYLENPNNGDRVSSAATLYRIADDERADSGAAYHYLLVIDLIRPLDNDGYEVGDFCDTSNGGQPFTLAYIIDGRCER
ncbi:MAG: hypothetical protein HN337_08615 [Deltaproteobacteria bacterium]|nr:hypothetical protein [Deltaproteobacteria bacterium]